MPLTNSVVFNLIKNPLSGRLEVGFEPTAEKGDVLQVDNLKELIFKSLTPFAIYVSRRLSGPHSTVLSPFKGQRILKSQRDPVDGVYRLSPADTKVDIPAPKFGHYVFCYLAILFTDDEQYPVVVSADPKIIIGKQNPMGSTVEPEVVTAHQRLNQFFPDGTSNRALRVIRKSSARKKPASKSKTSPKKKTASKSKALVRKPATRKSKKKK